MQTVLVISSFVAASRVGATASAFCLRRLGIETHVLPTTLLGRHPGWGPPGGGPVSAEMLEDMWKGIKAQNIRFDGVLTGYMATAEQVALTARIIADICAINPAAYILVDPVMGDHGHLYIQTVTARAMTEMLVPLADIITPNGWELGYITGSPSTTFNEICAAAMKISSRALITSVPIGHQIGAMIQSGFQSTYVRHDKFKDVPHGGGDALAGLFLGHIVNGTPPEDALALSVASVFDIMTKAAGEDMGELPLVRCQDALVSGRALPIERVKQ